MNLRDLKYLVAVADLNSFSQAAEACFVSQPTLSTQIKKLEDELGAAVFERDNRSVRLTEAGEGIIAAARRVLAEVDLIKAIAESAHDPLAGTFRLGAFPTLASYVFPAAVRRITQALPKLKLLLIEEKTDVLIEQLRTGKCDAALLALPVDDPALVAMKLFEDPFLLAVPTGHRLADQPQIDLASLAELKLLLLDEGHCLRDHALDVCHRHGGHEEPDFRATSMETLRMMVKAGTGITLMPQTAARDACAEIRYIPFAEPRPKRLIGLVWRKTTARGAVIEKLLDLLNDVGAGG
jgi:LysR family hydrogen peroxide-inducible transcriptional activator